MNGKYFFVTAVSGNIFLPWPAPLVLNGRKTRMEISAISVCYNSQLETNIIKCSLLKFVISLVAVPLAPAATAQWANQRSKIALI